jgi:deoxyribodipyrimidine photo-lyase
LWIDGYHSVVEKQHKVALFWFRRSVRLDDNRALLEAVANAEQVVPVFILDPTILTHPTTGQARTRFLFEALGDVDES